MMKLKIYTDGSCSPSSRDGGWAFCIPELNIRVCHKEKDTTVNRMELMAVIKALEFITDADLNIATYEIYSDSMYVIGGLTMNWSKEMNSDLWDELEFYINLTADRNVHFIHIKGHSGLPGNEEADKLAVLVRNLYE